MKEERTTSPWFRDPMLASPMPDTFDVAAGQWVAEEKFDGHRLIVAITDRATLFGTPEVLAWSRYGIERALPPHIRDVLERFPVGIYDGELIVPGQRSYGVTVVQDFDRLQLVLFDVLQSLQTDVTTLTYGQRRTLLCGTVSAVLNDPDGSSRARAVRVEQEMPLRGYEDIKRLALETWQRGGEGLIVKRTDSTYRVGKRSREWFKVKQLQSSEVTIVRFIAGKLGPYATALVRDDAGFETTVKTRNDALRAAAARQPERFIGARLVIEYQERTPDGSYRHPRWDRLANE